MGFSVFKTGSRYKKCFAIAATIAAVFLLSYIATGCTPSSKKDVKTKTTDKDSSKDSTASATEKSLATRTSKANITSSNNSNKSATEKSFAPAYLPKGFLLNTKTYSLLYGKPGGHLQINERRFADSAQDLNQMLPSGPDYRQIKIGNYVAKISKQTNGHQQLFMIKQNALIQITGTISEKELIEVAKSLKQ